MPTIVHALPRSEWERFRERGEYRPDSLEAQGFVHCSKPGQIVVVADYNYAETDEMMLLVLDESRIDAPVRYETNESSESAYPHVYGPLTLDAVVDAFRFEQDDTGFRLPADLLNVPSS